VCNRLVKGRFSTAFRGDRIVPALDLRYAGPRKTVAGNLTGGYTVANSTLSGRRLLPGLEVSASVYNPFDKPVADPGVPGEDAARPASFRLGRMPNGRRSVQGGPPWITLC
jgi:hypothetical protein